MVYQKMQVEVEGKVCYIDYLQYEMEMFEVMLFQQKGDMQVYVE